MAFPVLAAQRRPISVWPIGLMVLLVSSIPAAGQAPVCSYDVVNTYPHDADAYTQGLVYSDGDLLESTGLYDESSLRRVDLESGAILQLVPLDGAYFGEGLALWQNRLLQLTWLEQTCLIWDRFTLDPLGSFSYGGEGWGLTQDGRVLVMSDGSATIRFRDPDTFAVLGSVEVTDDGGPVTQLNELEWIRGEIFANVYDSDRIARIDPDTGEVIAWVDLTGILDPVPPGADVLNGIAWDDAGERLFVTGKRWPSLFEIVMVGCPELRLFGDGFESGSTIRWSGTAP
jgi:glutaminyl-peptide cyclotransferase